MPPDTNHDDPNRSSCASQLHRDAKLRFSQPLDRLARFWRRLVDALFDEDAVDRLFSHARNVLTCAVIIAAGLYAAHHDEALTLPGMWTVHVAGYVVAGLGGLLLLLNLGDGLRRLANQRHHLLLRLAAILVYVALSVRLTQVIVYFRSAT